MNTIEAGDRTLVPSKVVCIGRNYVAHIEELGNERPEEPVIFIKPNSAIADALVILLDQPLHYESELCFLVEHGQLAAVGFGFDLTRRDVQVRLKEKGLPWERSKAFDGSAVFSEFVPFVDLAALRLTLHLDGEPAQAGGVHHMIHAPDVLLREVQQLFTLEDGDVLMTGTPAGVGPLQAGCEYVGRIFEGERLLVEVRWQT